MTAAPKPTQVRVHHHEWRATFLRDAISSEPASAPTATPISRKPSVCDVPLRTLFAIAGISVMLGKAKNPVAVINKRKYL